MSDADIDQSAVLFLEYHDRLHRIARQLVGSSSDADDLVQETFLKVHGYLRNGNVIRTPLSFLLVTARSLVIDRYRRKRVQLVDPAIDVDSVVPEGEALSVERQVMSDREFEELCTAIAELPERTRHVFVLRKVYGYSCREIAESVERSTNTVREQVAQGFKKLQAQRQLQKEQSGEAIL